MATTLFTICFLTCCIQTVKKCIYKIKYRNKSQKKLKPNFVEVKEFENYVLKNSKNSYEPLINEYKKLNALSESVGKLLGLTTIVGRLPKNLNKNLTQLNVAYDQSRVKLPFQNSANDYINASTIPSNDNLPRVQYLACQGPIKETVDDFVLMLWDQKITTVIMLSDFSSDQNQNSQNVSYFPDLVEEKIKFSNNITITLDYQRSNERFTERILVLSKRNVKKSQHILHVQMDTWMENTAPNLKYFDAMLARIQRPTNVDVAFPYLVHCSDGIGRTGTFIAIDKLTRDVMSGASSISVYTTVLEIRRYRRMLVNNKDQYVFIYQYLGFFIQKIQKFLETPDFSDTR